MSAQVDVLDAIDNAVLGLQPFSDSAELREARAAVAELVEADHEYDAASRDWEQATSDDPLNLSDERWRQIADRFEAATMRRIAALAKFGGAP